MALCVAAALALTNSLVRVPVFQPPFPSNYTAPEVCTHLHGLLIVSRRILDNRERSLPLKCSVKILKRIPHASREQAAAKLAKILDVIVSKDGHDDHDSWDRLLEFSARCFHVPARRAKRCSLACMVNGQLREEVDPPVLRQTARSNCQSTKSFAKDPMAYLASRVSSKLEQGDFKGAVRLACSDALLLITVPPPLRSFSRSTPTLTLLLRSSLWLKPRGYLPSQCRRKRSFMPSDPSPMTLQEGRMG